MRIGLTIAIAMSITWAAVGQVRGVNPTPVVVGTAGSVVHPGSPASEPGVTRFPGSVVNPGGGGVHLVVPGQNRGQYSTPAGQYRSRGVYAYPVYVPSYYDSSYISQQPYITSPNSEPNVTYVMSQPQPAQPVTPVIINNYYGVQPPSSEMVREDRNRPVVEEVQPEPTHYLIAFQDHTVYSATAYWVDGDTLHYFTAGNTHNQVSISLIDRAFTERLNKEAGVEVRLPAVK